MSSYLDFSAIGDLIGGAWRPALLAMTTVFGGLAVAAMIPRGALGWLEGGVRSLTVAGWGRMPAGPTAPDDILAEPEDNAAPGRWLEHAVEPDPDAPYDTAAPEPAPATWAAQGEQILGRFCRMDTASTLGGLEFTMEVPGLVESDLEICLIGDTIVVSGQPDQDPADKTFRVVEREHGPFSRYIKVSEGVPLHRIQASLDRGLLTVFVPNPTVQVGKTIAVNSAVRRILDGDDACELKIDLPGVDETDVDLAIRDGMLTIRCRNRADGAKAGDQTAAALPPRLLQSMEIPAGVDANRIRAVLAKGVLTVTLPIAAGHRHRTIPLEVAGGAGNPETGPAEDRRPEAAGGEAAASTGDPAIVGACLSGRGEPRGQAADCPF